MKKKSLLALVVVLALCLPILAACAQDDGAGAAADEVHIGFMGVLSGGIAHFGISVQQGAMLYIDAFNERGGLQINVTVRDDEHDPALAVTMYHDLIDQGVTAILGSVTSGPTMAIVPLAYEDRMPMISASATHAGVTVDQDTGRVFTNMFRSCFIDPFQGMKMAEFAHQILGAQTAAVLYAHDIDYSIGLMQAFVDRAAEIGLEVVITETFAGDAIDYTAQLANIAAADPDVLFVPGYVDHTSLIGPQSVAAGVNATLLGADGWAGTLETIADPSTVEGTFFLTGFTDEADEPHIVDFIQRFEAEHGIPPNMFAAQAYDAAAILIRAIEAALADGYTAGDDDFRESVISHMAATDFYGVTGHITFDRYNNPQKTAFIIQIVDGEERFWGTF